MQSPPAPTPTVDDILPPLSPFGTGDAVSVKTTVGVSFSPELAAAVGAAAVETTERRLLRPPTLDFRRSKCDGMGERMGVSGGAIFFFGEFMGVLSMPRRSWRSMKYEVISK